MNVRRPIPIALVITELEVGGAERCLTELAIRLPRPEFEPRVIALAGEPRRDALLQQLAARDIPTQFLGLRSSLQLPTAVRRLRECLRESSEAVVQSFLFHANVSVGLSIADHARHLLGVRVADPRRWRLALERHFALRAAGVVCVSQSVAQFCRNQQRLNGERLHVIGNGVEVSEPDDASSGTRSAELPELPFDSSLPYLLFVGRLDHQKGLDWLLTGLPEVLARFPEHQVVLAGDGPLEKKLHSQAAGLGIDGRVHFVGWVSQPRLWMRAAELLILPSRWEGMPNVLLEAMAERRPVLSTPVEGVGEILGEDAEPQTMVFGDHASLVGKLASLLEDEPLRRRLGEGNRRRVVEHFSLQAMVDAYADLFRKTAQR